MKKVNEYMGIKLASEFLGVTPNTLRNWDREKKLQTYRNPQNHYRLYVKEDLEQVLNKITPRPMQ